jgi:GT2 family glycosyltransferase
VVGSCVGAYRPERNLLGRGKYAEAPRRTAWLKGPQVIHASVMMRRQDIVSVAGYDERALRMEDYDLWLRLIHKGCVITHCRRLCILFIRIVPITRERSSSTG